MKTDEITGAVIAAAIRVHRTLGPGLLESTYEHCLAIELTHAGIPFDRQLPLPVVYRDVAIDSAYRLDFLVAGTVIVEVKAVAALDAVHLAQLLTYLKVSGKRVGLLINFNVAMLKQGIRRVIL